MIDLQDIVLQSSEIQQMARSETAEAEKGQRVWVGDRRPDFSKHLLRLRVGSLVMITHRASARMLLVRVHMRDHMMLADEIGGAAVLVRADDTMLQGCVCSFDCIHQLKAACYMAGCQQ